MNLCSHGRSRRLFTSFRSGPTLMPLPNVWHAVQRLLNVAAASAENFAPAVSSSSSAPADHAGSNSTASNNAANRASRLRTEIFTISALLMFGALRQTLDY